MTGKIDTIIKELTFTARKSIYGTLKDKLPAKTIRGLLATKQKKPVSALQDLFENPSEEKSPKVVCESPIKIITTSLSEVEIRELSQNIINGLSQTIGRSASKSQKRSTVYKMKTGVEISKKSETLPRNFGSSFHDCFGTRDPLCTY